jgi:hypothetical protein
MFNSKKIEEVLGEHQLEFRKANVTSNVRTIFGNR